MQYTLTLAMVLSALSAVVAQAGTLMVSTPPNFIVCTPASISFSGGQAPYIISVIPGGMVSAAALETFPTQAAAGAYTWNVDLPAGTTVTIQIRDATGVLNYSAMNTILAGTSTACIGASSSGGAASTPAGGAVSSPAGGAATTSSRTSAVATTPPTSGSATSVPASSTTPATTPATSSTAVAASTAGSTAPAASTSVRSGASALSYGYNALALVGAAVLAVAA